MNLMSWKSCRRCLTVHGMYALLLAAGAASCGKQGAAKAADPAMADPFTTDTTYLRRVAYLKEMSYQVPMDSLTRMYVFAADVSPEDAPALARKISCESSRLAVQYGVIPASQAHQRLTDSIRKARPELFRRAIRNLNRVGSVITTNSGCNLAGIKPAADSLNSTPGPEVIMRKLRSKGMTR